MTQFRPDLDPHHCISDNKKRRMRFTTAPQRSLKSFNHLSSGINSFYVIPVPNKKFIPKSTNLCLMAISRNFFEVGCYWRCKENAYQDTNSNVTLHLVLERISCLGRRGRSWRAPCRSGWGPGTGRRAAQPPRGCKMPASPACGF